MFGVSYVPPWSKGQTCTGCEAQPDPKQAFAGTWSDITYDPSIAARATPQNATFDFTGSAIYVFGIQSLSTTLPVSGADILFSIDGEVKGGYKFTPTQENDGYTYNQLLFSIEDLDESSHALQIQNGQFGGGISLVLLDYIVYSTDDGTGGATRSNASPTTSPSTAPVPQTPASPLPQPTTNTPNPDTRSATEPQTSPGPVLISANPTTSLLNTGTASAPSGTSSSTATSSKTDTSTDPSNPTSGAATSTQTLISTIVSGATIIPSSTSELSASGHAHGLSDGARIGVIAASVALGVLLLALLGWCFARRRKPALSYHAALLSGTAEQVAPLTETDALRSPMFSEPAPSYISVFPAPAVADGDPESAESQPRTRQSEKALYVPRAAPSAGDPSLRGSLADSGSIDGGRRYTRSEFAWSAAGSSMAPLTAPPMYASSEGGTAV
ncbi:hypothetical protein PsYK624_053950 [Phanerochaete sordida]|uniref:Uncharacterized protein n=1 Tax=Phanerochaete sordida TaxID=48140 RepID=A0A9P3G512_9APHY|nr:hypothetical protein PsYK624_053950 [Phanerochaete sordida]